MNLRINGNTQDIQDVTILSQLIEQITGEKDPVGVAVAINGSVVSRSVWTKQTLSEGDDIEILGAVSGG
jgi:sulfur carrier protein